MGDSKLASSDDTTALITTGHVVSFPVAIAGTSALVLAWYISNTLSSFHTKLVFEDTAEQQLELPSYVALALFLSFCQLAFSGIIGLAYAATRSSVSPWNSFLREKDFQRKVTFIAVCNAIGCVATNIGYIYGSVSLVQLIKAMEPVATFLAEIFFLKTHHNLTTASGVMLVILGACYASYQDSSFNYVSVVAACLSNAVLPFRNVFTKSYSSSRQEHHPSGFLLFSLVSSVGAVIVGVISVVAIAFWGISLSWDASVQALLSSVTYLSYNSFSFLVLHRMDAVMHAILNVFKRAFNIVTSMMFFHQDFTTSFCIGLTVAIAGLFVYLIGKKKIPPCACTSKLRVAFTVICAMIVTSQVMFKEQGDLSSLSSDGSSPINYHGIRASTEYLSRIAPQKFDRLAYVPFDAYNTCDDKFTHVTCLRTVVVSSAGPIEYNPLLQDALCQNWLEKGTRDTHSMLCLQVGDTVGSLLEVSSTGAVSRFLLPSDAPAVAESFQDFRIVDRITVAMSGYHDPSHSAEAMEAKAKDENVGNLVWEYGATRMMNPYTTQIVHEREETARLSASAFVIATANALNLENNSTLSNFVGYLKGRTIALDSPTIMLGIGIQAEFGDDVDTTSLRLFDHQRDFLREVEKRQQAKSIAVRGDLTRTACENAGITHCISMGCPSLTISREINLGKALKGRWSATHAKLNGGEKLKVALTMPALKAGSQEEFDKLIDIFEMICEAHDCTFIYQAPFDKVNLMKTDLGARLDESQLLVFSDVELWFEYLRGMDLVMSVRIHGAMAGMASATPTIVIPTDLRISELVDAMMIPTIPIRKLKGPYKNLGEVLELVEMDLERFETNRQQKLIEYHGILASAGIEMDPGLLQVLNA